MKLRWQLMAVVLSSTAVVLAQTSSGIADRQVFLFRALDSWSLDLSIATTMMQDPYPMVRAQAVNTMASNPEPARHLLLGNYLLDHDAGVREQVMLAAGRLGALGLGLATRGLNDPSPAVRQAAVWAASHAGKKAWPSLSKLATTEKNTAVLEMLLANLWRLEDVGWQSIAGRFAADANPYLRRAAAFSLSRNGDPSARRAQRLLAVDGEPVIRATALRGFERGALDTADLAVVVAAIADSDWRVQAAAWRALAAQEDAKAPATLGSAFAAAVSSSHPHLAAAALAAATTHATVGTSKELLEVINGDDPWLAGEALVALGDRNAAAVKETATSWSNAAEIWQRRASARVAVRLGAEAEARAAADADPGVRLAWLGSLEDDEVTERREGLVGLLESDPDPAVRAQILSLMRDSESQPDSGKLLKYAMSWKNDDMVDARAQALVGAYAAAATKSEKGSILELGLKDIDPVVAAMVVNEARSLGAEVVLPPREARHNGRWYRELVEWRVEPKWLDVSTNRGTFRIRLDSENAPLTSREIWDLAVDGFYDGLAFHRVVPNFVVQGGDPRGDGWGGPGFALPDEPSLQPFDSWRVGVATSGPQTGGCQLFVTLTPADHLTGHYTNIGEVVAGREVLTKIRVGDRMVKVQAMSGAEPPPLGE